MSVLSELKRRNVFRVALLYLVGSWLVLQMADVGVSLLGLPEWTGRLAFLLLTLGFPFVLVFSWAYEITPDGVKREKDVDRSESVTHETARKLDTAVIVLLVLSIVALGLDRFMPRQENVATESVINETSEVVETAVSERSIAVLPFVNMSADPENEYFSDGLSEELLNLLAKIPELRVAARTSSFRFKGSTDGIPEIASQLNVAHVLEGSVRKSGDQLRITAQLISADDGYHLWSETWDRTLVDVFAIQDEIAAAVVDALSISLLGQLPATKVTDPEAYALYLQAKKAAYEFTESGIDDAIALLTQALAIDPDYGNGWAALGAGHTNKVGQGFVAAEVGYPQASAAYDRALAIDPENVRALSGQGWIAMYGDHDFARAKQLIESALAIEPGNASVLNAYSVLHGVFEQAASGLSYLNEALVSDPFATPVLMNLAGLYVNEGRYDEAQTLYDRVAEMRSDPTTVIPWNAWIQSERGNSEIAVSLVDGNESIPGLWVQAVANYDIGNDSASDVALQKLIDAGTVDNMVATVCAYRGQIDKAFQTQAGSRLAAAETASSVPSNGASRRLHQRLRGAALGLVRDAARTVARLLGIGVPSSWAAGLWAPAVQTALTGPSRGGSVKRGKPDHPRAGSLSLPSGHETGARGPRRRSLDATGWVPPRWVLSPLVAPKDGCPGDPIHTGRGDGHAARASAGVGHAAP